MHGSSLESAGQEKFFSSTEPVFGAWHPESKNKLIHQMQGSSLERAGQGQLFPQMSLFLGLCILKVANTGSFAKRGLAVTREPDTEGRVPTQSVIRLIRNPPNDWGLTLIMTLITPGY